MAKITLLNYFHYYYYVKDEMTNLKFTWEAQPLQYHRCSTFSG